MNNNRQPDNVKKAQVDSSPELSSVLKEMKNGFDIQPLDDIEKDEIVQFEDNVIESVSPEEEKTKEEAVIPTHSSQKKESHKKFIRAGIVMALIICVIIGVYFSFFHIDDFSYGATAIYKKGSIVNVLLENNDIIQLEDTVQFKLSDNGKVLVYSQDTDSKTGKYDIRVIDFSKRTSVKNKGSVVVSGAEEMWNMEKSGGFVYYSKSENGSIKYYAYSTETNEIKMIVADATEFFVPPMGDICYFTRERNGTTMLYRTRFGEETESLGDVENVKAVANEEIMEIFYTIPGESVEENDFTLYKISGDGSSVKIAENVSEVYLDDYTPGGNLYYFIKNNANLNWSDFVEDPYQDSDAAMQKPDKGDYLITVGFFFKRTKLDEQAYNRAMAEYNKKLTRDKIRDALDELDLGLAVSTEFIVKAYDGQMSKELASSVKLENLIAFAKTGAPRIIFKTSGIDASRKIEMNELYKMAESKGVEASVDLVLTALSSDYEISTGCKYSWYDGNKVMSYDFEPGIKVEGCTFDFLGRESVIASVITDDTTSSLYISSINGKEISKSALISDKVVSYEINGNNLYYTISYEQGVELFVYSSEKGSVSICENNVQYFVVKPDKAIMFKGNYDNGILSDADILLYSEGESTVIDKGVSATHFAVDKDSFAYIKDFKTAAATDTSSPTGGELKLYSQGKEKSLDTEVSEIYAIKQ